MYNRQKAVTYAQQWALKRNPNYVDFENMGGDCTNFISQCLYAGEIDFSYENYGWFYHSLSSRSPSWTGVDELYSFGINNNSNKGPMLTLAKIEDIKIGDIIQLKTNNYWTHSLIISKITGTIKNENIYVCSHSYDRLNRKLSSIIYDDIRFLKVL